jgi:hypothetical protein
LVLEEEHCSYLIDPPPMKDNDYITVEFKELKALDVTIMIVKEDESAPGGLAFDPTLTFKPYENKKISFFLQKLHLFDLHEKRLERTPSSEKTPYKLLVLI